MPKKGPLRSGLFNLKGNEMNEKLVKCLDINLMARNFPEISHSTLIKSNRTTNNTPTPSKSADRNTKGFYLIRWIVKTSS